MKRNYQPKKMSRDNVRRESEPLSWKYFLVTIASGAVLVGGFFVAARTHFASINYCIKNSELKKQLGELEAEKRRLILSKEIALAPAEIKKAARKLGLVEISAMNIETFGAPQTRTDADTRPLVIKTVDTKPVEKPRAVVAAESQERKAEKSVKQAPEAAGSRERRVSKTGK